MTSSRDEILLEADFDRRVMGYGRLAVRLVLLVTLVGSPLIPLLADPELVVSAEGL